MQRVLITGVSGYIGGKIARCLAGVQVVETLVGLDIRPPDNPPARLIFREHDVRRPMTALLGRFAVDTVVHAAYVLTPLHDRALMEDINIAGTLNVLKACREAGVGHLLYTSSATAYGCHPDNPVPLTEESPLRGNDALTYSKTKKAIEGHLKRFVRAHKRTAVTILRPCFVVGPGFDNPLARHLRKRVVLGPQPSSPMQFVHEDDLVRLIRLCLEERITGTFNVAGEGTLALSEMARIMGNVYCPLPYDLLYGLNQMAWALRLHGLTAFPSPALVLLRYPWIVSSQRLKRSTGFRFQYTTRQAFAAFADACRG
jgi:UDP-glucose 4-epimerase